MSLWIAGLGQQDIQIVVPWSDADDVLRDKSGLPEKKDLSLVVPRSMIPEMRERFAKLDPAAISFDDRPRGTFKELQRGDADWRIDADGLRLWLMETSPIVVNLHLLKKIRDNGHAVERLYLVSTDRQAAGALAREKWGEHKTAFFVDREPSFAGPIALRGARELWPDAEVFLHELGQEPEFIREVEQAENAEDAWHAIDLRRCAYPLVDAWVRRIREENDGESVVPHMPNEGGIPFVQRSLEDAVWEYFGEGKGPEDWEQSAKWRNLYEVRRTLRRLIDREDFQTASRYLDDVRGMRFPKRVLGIRPVVRAMAEFLAGRMDKEPDADQLPSELDAWRTRLRLLKRFYDEPVPLAATATRLLWAARSKNAANAFALAYTLIEMTKKRWLYRVLVHAGRWEQLMEDGLPEKRWKVRRAVTEDQDFDFLTFGPRGEPIYFDKLSKKCWDHTAFALGESVEKPRAFDKWTVAFLEALGRARHTREHDGMGVTMRDFCKERSVRVAGEQRALQVAYDSQQPGVIGLRQLCTQLVSDDGAAVELVEFPEMAKRDLLAYLEL